jgi:hypothetical protein
MKILHILKTEPDNNTKALMTALGEPQGKETTVFTLFDERADYEKLIDLIFQHEKIFSWW